MKINMSSKYLMKTVIQKTLITTETKLYDKKLLKQLYREWLMEVEWFIKRIS